MLFPSLAFLVFAALFFLLWPWARREAGRRWAFLTGASLFFYGWWDWRFVLLIIFSGLLDFVAAQAMVRQPGRRRWWLALSLVGNLGALSIFKYSVFLASSLDTLLGTLGLATDLVGALPGFTLILPVGISFYTFQSLSYTLDVYRGRLAPTPHLWHFMAYLCLFPQLVAGPIVRASSLLAQLQAAPVPDEAARWAATRRIVAGFFQKLVLADNLAPLVEQAFGPGGPDSAWYHVLALTAFAFQIYFDFAGYSHIAIGLLGWMGYEVGENFRQPYLATSLRDFWGRWHISLSTWFRDYVYIPLGGGRRGVGRGLWALWATMLLSGLWHGAAWHFVVWGAWHAAGLSLERLVQQAGRRVSGPGVKLLGWVWTWAVVWLGWVWFRASSAGAALAFLDQLWPPGSESYTPGIDLTCYLLLALAWEPASRGVAQWRSARWWAYGGEPILVACGIAASVLLRGPGTEFIYFQF